ncbi:uncharacterized protein METZ01_LOCUS462077 [marine metagenome]|uniref:Uncharacterized protein n=1 Tax=marine metagenome TaxID=408172 RepID=A0A383ANP8_9ZZZZ
MPIEQEDSPMKNSTSARRYFLAAFSALGLSGMMPASLLAQQKIPLRRIPGTNESLPIIGLGSSKPVSQIADTGVGPISEVLRTLVAQGGRGLKANPSLLKTKQAAPYGCF